MTRYLSLFLASLALVSACGSSDNDDDPTIKPATEQKDEAANAEPKTDPPDDQTKAPDDKTPDDETPGATTPDPPAVRQPCSPPTGIVNNPQSIAQAVTLINALPRPVTTACFLEVLQRPLHFNATTSGISVQPAGGTASPRIFLFMGPTLIVSFVPAGEGSGTVEFSQLINNSKSVKAEIAFPVADPLTSADAFKRILNANQDGTSCSGCHAQEVPAGAAFGEHAFVSRALRPFPTQDVSLIDFKLNAAVCKDDPAASCEIVRALLDHGDVLPKAFPEDMPTIF